MREMKDSGIAWIGEIPHNWKIQRLKYAFSKHSGGIWGLNPSDSETEAVCVRVADFDYPHLMVNFSPNMTRRGYTYKNLEEAHLQTNDILLEKSGGGESTPVGRSVLYTGDDSMTCANFIEYLRAEEKFDPRFLNYWLNTSYIFGLSKRNVKQTTGIQNLDISALLSEKICVPHVEEQQKISNYIAKKCEEIENLIVNKQKSNTLLLERRQSIIFEAVTKGLNSDVLMKESNVFWLGSIPAHWLLAPLKYYASIATGVALGKQYKERLDLHEFPYLRVANVQRGYVDLKDIAIIQLPEKEANQYMLQPGNLLMTEGGDRDKLGRGCVWHGEMKPMLHQNHVFALTTNDKLNVEYLNYIIMSDAGKTYFDFTAKKTTNLASTNSTTIMNFKIPVPSRSEQDEIVAYLDKTCAEIDKVIEKNNSTIQKLKEYRQTLIYEAVTGKIEV